MPSSRHVSKSQEAPSSVQALVSQIALAQATELARAGKYVKAERLLNEMAQDATISSNALDLLARIRAQQGRFKEAETLWMQVLQREPSNRQAQAALHQVRHGRMNRVNRLGAMAVGLVIVGVISLLTLYTLPPSSALPTPTIQVVQNSTSTPTSIPIPATTIVTVVVTTTPVPSSTPAPSATPAPTFTPQVITIVATPQPRWNVLRLDPTPKYRVGRISCDQSNPQVWHHGEFTIEGTVYVPTYLGPLNEPRNWANHKQVGGAQSSTATPQVINETEQWIERLYILPLLENGGPGTWYVWVIEDGKRVSEVAQIIIDPTCRHGVVDFQMVDIR